MVSYYHLQVLAAFAVESPHALFASRFALLAGATERNVAKTEGGYYFAGTSLRALR